MDQQNLMSHYHQWVWALVALAVGLLSGYFYGSEAGLRRGRDEGILQGIAQEKAVAATKRKEAAEKAAAAVNPFEQTSNPFEKSPVNPYKDVKVNPFK